MLQIGICACMCMMAGWLPGTCSQQTDKNIEQNNCFSEANLTAKVLLSEPWPPVNWLMYVFYAYTFVSFKGSK